MRPRLARCALVASCVFAGCRGSDVGDLFPTQPVRPPGASKTAADYISDIVTLMQSHALVRARIDWADFRAQVAARSAGAQTIPDTYPAVVLALDLLDDHHSLLETPSGERVVGTRRSLGCTAPAVAAVALPADIGYVRVRSFGEASPAAVLAFADDLQGQIRAVDRPGLTGWIVDLRGNVGGNMWPMIAGIGPLLGEGRAGYFVYPDGRRKEWGYQAGASFSGSFVQARTSAAYVLSQPAPSVAVLVDRLVGSAGEATFIAFRGRPRTRSFGTATCGRSTSNAPFPLSDGSRLVLTTSVMADRDGREYGGPVEPDETIDEPPAALERAVAWLRSSD